MNKTFKEVLLYSLIPLAILLLVCLSGNEGILMAGMLMLLVAGIYGFAGIVLIIARKEHVGKVLLLSAGIILLIGFSTCGLMMNGMSFH